MMEGLMQKAIDNLQVSFTNLHFRLETDGSGPNEKPVSAGFTLQAMDIHTTDDEWLPI